MDLNNEVMERENSLLDGMSIVSDSQPAKQQDIKEDKSLQQEDTDGKNIN